MTRRPSSDDHGQAALAYAGGRGWLVFPVCPVDDCPWEGSCPAGQAGKHPLIDGGCTRATRDPQRIARWWGRWPAANIGVATGPESGIFVVDLDADHDGFSSLAKLEHGHGRGLSTLECATGGGGSHLHFAWPDGVAGEQLRNSAGKLGHGIDVRAAGGYVLVPPSRHRSGQRYRWCDAYTQPLPAPAWLLDQLLRPSRAPEPTRRPRRAPLPFAGRPHGPGYVARALERERDQLLVVPEGQRHDELVRSATRIGTLLHLVTEAEAEAIGEALVQTGQDMGLPEKEAAAVVDDQLAYGRAHPRNPRNPA